MNEGETNDSSREDRLNEILLKYLRAVDVGEQPDPQEWISRHPEFAQELEEYFEDQEHLEALGSPGIPQRQAAEPNSEPASGSGDAPTTPFPDIPPPPGSRIR